MELFEKINRAFGSWYEGLFASGDDVRPRDILRRIIAAMEDYRKEGIDGKVYVPNQYILEVSVEDEDEREYLLSFLDREELETAIRRYCRQYGYEIRGRLDFTIKQVAPAETEKADKVRVRCRYDSRLAAEKPAPAPPKAPPPPEEENLTAFESDVLTDMGTVPEASPARVEVHTEGKAPFEVSIPPSGLSIGRSSRAGNDLVLDQDGMVSRRHARIEREVDGRYTIYDLQTTNGTRVNGVKVDNRTLDSGDEIRIGSTRLVFRQQGGAGAPLRREAARAMTGRTARLILTDGVRDLESFPLASETRIGRGVTNDIVLDDRSVATRHALVRRGDPFTLEALDSDGITLINGQPLAAASPKPLQDGDRIVLGAVTLRYEAEAP